MTQAATASPLTPTARSKSFATPRADRGAGADQVPPTGWSDVRSVSSVVSFAQTAVAFPVASTSTSAVPG